MALLLEGEKAAKAAQANMGLCMNQLFDMICSWSCADMRMSRGTGRKPKNTAA